MWLDVPTKYKMSQDPEHMSTDGVERGGYDDQNMDKDGDERGRPRVEPRRPRVETLADRVKRYGSALKEVVSPMPSDATEILQFFESLEAMFRLFELSLIHI